MRARSKLNCRKSLHNHRMDMLKSIARWCQFCGLNTSAPFKRRGRGGVLNNKVKNGITRKCGEAVGPHGVTGGARCEQASPGTGAARSSACRCAARVLLLRLCELQMGQKAGSERHLAVGKRGKSKQSSMLARCSVGGQ